MEISTFEVQMKYDMTKLDKNQTPPPVPDRGRDEPKPGGASPMRR